MATPEYAEAIKHMTDCANICFKINTTVPTPEQIRPLEEQLFDGNLDQTSYLMPPLQIDFARQMKIGRGVFVNHSLTCMAAGGITIDDGVMIGPNVRIVTDNHDFENRMVLRCKARPHRPQRLDWRGCHHPAHRHHRRECRRGRRSRRHQGRCPRHHRRRQSRKVYQKHII